MPSVLAVFAVMVFSVTLFARQMASEQARTVPAGTPLKLQLETRLSTADNHRGDGFAARVMVSVYYKGKEVVPQGSIVEGHVLEVQDSRPAVNDSEMLLRPDLLTTPDGTQYTMKADVMEVDNGGSTRVDSEGVMHDPRGPQHADVVNAGVGLTAGAMTGAVLAGGKAALVGGGIGVAIAGGLWLLRKRHLELKPGAHIIIRLDRPMTLQPKAAPAQ